MVYNDVNSVLELQKKFNNERTCAHSESTFSLDGMKISKKRTFLPRRRGEVLTDQSPTGIIQIYIYSNLL
jgi:hypothetical protein